MKQRATHQTQKRSAKRATHHDTSRMGRLRRLTKQDLSLNSYQALGYVTLLVGLCLIGVIIKLVAQRAFSWQHGLIQHVLIGLVYLMASCLSWILPDGRRWLYQHQSWALVNLAGAMAVANYVISLQVLVLVSSYRGTGFSWFMLGYGLGLGTWLRDLRRQLGQRVPRSWIESQSWLPRLLWVIELSLLALALWSQLAFYAALVSLGFWSARAGSGWLLAAFYKLTDHDAREAEPNFQKIEKRLAKVPFRVGRQWRNWWERAKSPLWLAFAYASVLWSLSQLGELGGVSQLVFFAFTAYVVWRLWRWAFEQ